MTVAVVTGASRGIGRETAHLLAERGATLALLGRPSAALDETARSTRRASPRVEVFEVNLAAAGEVVRAARQVLDVLGPPTVIVHNAAVVHRAPLEDLRVEDWDEQVAVNLTASFLLTKGLLASMKEAGRPARIVFVGSISSVVGTAKQTGYNATKWGLLGLVKSLALELSGGPVSTVAVLPGSVDTRMLEGSGFVARMTPREVAQVIVYHALDAPGAHNGGVVELFGT